MGTPVTNFPKGTVSIGYTNSATSIVLSTGHGSRFPSTFPFPVTWWNASDYSDPSDDPDREIVTVTNRAGDTLTVTRGAEGTSASAKNIGGKTYKMIEGITKAMWDALSERALAQTFRGLRVQTHPDSDKAAAQVQFSAQAIVMDDGEEVSGWSKITVDIAASGVNGLDTGSEAASAWHELYAIYNGTTKAGLLHRAKEYFLDETWDQSGGTTDSGQHLLRDASARTRLAQGFQVDTAGPLEMVDVKIGKVGTPTGRYWFTIEATSGGVPSNTPLATSDKYDVSRLTTTANFVRMIFRTPASLSAATQYHLVMHGDFTISGANHVFWRADTAAATYANGSKGAYDGATWTNDTDDDFLFKIYITRNDVAVTLPAGYPQKALIGYVYNNSSSDLKRFSATDRSIRTAMGIQWQVGTYSNGPKGVQDASAVLPPITCRALLSVGFAVTGEEVSVGMLMATDQAAGSDIEDNATVRGIAGLDAVPGSGTVGPITVEYNGFNVEFATSTSPRLWIKEFTW